VSWIAPHALRTPERITIRDRGRGVDPCHGELSGRVRSLALPSTRYGGERVAVLSPVVVLAAGTGGDLVSERFGSVGGMIRTIGCPSL
jgi:hypothetical protein